MTEILESKLQTLDLYACVHATVLHEARYVEDLKLQNVLASTLKNA